MKIYLLVFDDGAHPDIDLQGFVETLDENAEMYTLDGHVCFVRSGLSVSELSDNFLSFAGSSLFFVTELSPRAYSGRMLGVFWEFLERSDRELALESAAE